MANSYENNFPAFSRGQKTSNFNSYGKMLA